jgi:aspartyl protease family protein
MRNIMLIAAGLLIVCGYTARVADKTSASVPQLHSAQAAHMPRPAPAGAHSMTLFSDRLGHFPVDAQVEGRRVDFVVDSGASLVALRARTASDVGLTPRPADYKVLVSTANGTVKGARVRLNDVTIGDITIYDVDALVLPDSALHQNLLGVSFLSRLRRYEYAEGRMVLEQ